MSDVESVKALLQSIQQIIENNDKEDRANGDLFNFFEVCKIHTKEIRHSMFIAELLNPKGSHGQGDMFLREFLAVLGAKENAPDEEILSRFCSEKTTVWTEFRSIDISLYTDSDVIIIENKINALTRPGQLFDYVNKWKDGDWKKNVRAVVYLTPNGREPEKDSLVPALKELLIMIRRLIPSHYWSACRIRPTLLNGWNDVCETSKKRNKIYVLI